MRMTEWRKSSYSGEGNSDCVEVAWRKSSYSGAGNGDCVEVALEPLATAVRDSKNATGPQLRFPSDAWRSFVTSDFRQHLRA
jgi:uncharacterized protein DUF397